ncbi:syndecan-3-like [Notechis scutatus]|uniref:Syndecan n=1 Tax=Notechis scutatus TaxID=8663 RepID=A0A6J1V5Y1_9SAUR|nr:syndecan-3-like [Notechis scutatus]
MGPLGYLHDLIPYILVKVESPGLPRHIDFKQDPGSKSVVRLTTDSPIVLATTSAVMPVTSVQPVATPLAPLPTEEVISESATNGLYIPRISEVPAVTIWKAVGVTATPAARDVATTTMTTTASSMATTASATTVTSRPTTALRDLLPVITIVAVTQSMMLETPTTATVARTEIPASPLGTTTVIVGGVVGALFATFLVMLLIYRMKKKDEGSYTLEEPKQASVTYQKPDKQEEFYA